MGLFQQQNELNLNPQASRVFPNDHKKISLFESAMQVVNEADVA